MVETALASPPTPAATATGLLSDDGHRAPAAHREASAPTAAPRRRAAGWQRWFRFSWLRLALLLTGLAALGLGLHWIAQPVSTGAASGYGVRDLPVRGDQAQPAPIAASGTLRLASYNIHGGKGRDEQRDLTRIAADLRGFDLIGLNEVHGPRGWNAGSQAAGLGRQLGMGWLFAPSARTWQWYDAGNALLSARPIGPWQRIPLERCYERSYRNCLRATMPCGKRSLELLLTHVNRSHDPERRQQLAAVFALFLSLPEPCVLLGDLNSTPDDPQLRALLARDDVIDALGSTDALDSTDALEGGRIDWILVRGARVVEAGAINSGASDHPLIWAELQLPE